GDVGGWKVSRGGGAGAAWNRPPATRDTSVVLAYPHPLTGVCSPPGVACTLESRSSVTNARQSAIRLAEARSICRDATPHDRATIALAPSGVPWNNNNAENAIKRFAYYREDTVGVMKEAGLKDYLVLLSLCHTCRYRGVSFLKFLLSRLKDGDAFCAPGGARRPRPAIEVYPKGFVPYHLARLREKGQARSTQSVPTPVSAEVTPPPDGSGQQ